MKKMALLALLTGAAIMSGCAGSNVHNTAELPVSKVVMYQNGVGYMERLGKLDGDELVLRVQTDQINDILKSLTVIDRGTGRPISISLPVDPETLNSISQIPEQISEDGGILELLEAFRGAHVKVSAKSRSYEGRIVGVEEMVTSGKKNGHDTTFETDRLLSIANEDTIYVVNVKDITSVQLYDRSLSVGLDKSLDMSLSSGDWKPVEFRIRMSNNKSRDIQLSYIVAMPTWKPAYRLILDDSDKALLQGWAVISNVSGSDWEDISFSLVSGQPMSFTYDLYRPHFLERDDLSDQMQTRALAPKVQSSGYARSGAGGGGYGMGGMANPSFGSGAGAAALAYAPEPESAYKPKKAAKAYKPSGTKSGVQASRTTSNAASDDWDDFDFGTEAEFEITNEDIENSFAANATSTQVGSLYEYKLDGKLTVPDGSSALVNLIQSKISSTETRLFESSGSLQSTSYHNVQIKNDTGYDLEPGPITIYKNGAFIGEGFLSKTAPDAVAQVTFAAENRLTLKLTENEDAGESSIRQVRNGSVTAEVGRVHHYNYVLTNNAAEPLTAGIKLHRDSFWTPVDFPEGTITTADSYVIPIQVDAQSKKEFTLSMKGANGRVMRLNTVDGYNAIVSALKIQEFQEGTRKQLEEYVKMFESRQDINTKTTAIENRKKELNADSAQISHSLSELKDVKTSSGNKLKEQLIKRQSENEKELAGLSTQLAELHVQSLEIEVKFKELLRNLNFTK